ncbi:DivIVA domain-containing protein [Streptomyces sp. ME19-03-3]|nr:DivIVA domain-containing protein [Streptomyces sp. ME19-03-3]
MAQTPITPEYVRRKQFTTVRLREAYDEREVDDFLDEAQAELTRLLKTNQDLRAKVSAAEAAAAAAPQPQETHEATSASRPESGPEAAVEPEQERQPEQGPEPEQEQQPAPGPATEAAEGPDAEGAEGPDAEGAADKPRSGFAVDSSARLLTLAERTAEQAVSEARAEAHKIIGEALGQAENLRRDSRERAQALEHAARERHREAMVALASSRTALQRKVDDLRTFENAYRGRLTAHMQSQLRRLDRDLARSLTPHPAPTSVSLTRAPTKPTADSRSVTSSADPAGPAPQPPGTAALTTAGPLSGEED